MGLPSEETLMTYQNGRRRLVQCFSIVPHQTKTNGMIIVQQEATVGVNTNKIFQIRRQHVPGPSLPNSVILHVKSILSEYALLEKSKHKIKTSRLMG